MRSTRYSLFVLLMILVFCSFLNAQQPTPSAASAAVVPRLVNFSGKALDEQGKPISGTATAIHSAAPTSWSLYALKAADAETLGGKPDSAFAVASANSESTTVDPNSPSADVSGTGTANHLARWKNSTTLETSAIYQGTGSKIGIATTTPAATLDVNGTIFANGNTGQQRTSGGWVKAMVFYSGLSNGIAYCFNSTLAGAAATTPPCGFTPTRFGTGDYQIDFGFQVDDRFFSVGGGGGVNTVCTDTTAAPGCEGTTVNANQAELILRTSTGGSLFDTKLYLIVY
jgi:hypothetical protein